jgi:alpha,alpha-trehalase
MTSCTLDLKQIDAAIFDLDGVVVDSAGLHAEAWQQMFNEFLLLRGREDDRKYPLFDYERDYLPLVDGKPRYVGVAAFLKSRHIDLPYGDPADDPERPTVCGLGNRKNRIFNQLLQSKGAKPYDPAVALIRRFKEKHLKTALVTSSKNGRAVLKSAALTNLFDVIVDGNDARDHRLEGKPAPDAFLLAVRQLGIPPERAVVFEDAQSGVEAGRRGRFGRVIGVDRADQAEGLRRHGADCVVKDLGNILFTHDKQPSDEARGLASALDQFGAIKKLLTEKEPFVYLDFDGTLTPIVTRPEDARLSEQMRAVIKALAEQCTVAIVSGRDLEDVRRRVGVPELYYAGSHGFDIRGPENRRITHRQGEQFLPNIEEADRLLQQRLQGIDGVQIERKRFAVAVHYRRAPREKSGLIAQIVEQVRDQVGGLRLSSGKKVFDLQPDLNWNKGKAVRWLMQEALRDLGQILPIYIGDDVTDEDAFEELRGIGLGIVVDEEDRPSRARYRLRDTGEVQTFLQRIAQWLNERTAWQLEYRDYEPGDEKLREALCTLGNGYFCTRGASAQACADAVHYPGTYLAGGYNRLKTEIAGHIIENEDLVNIPNWLPLNFRIVDEPWFSIEKTELLSYQQDLDVRNGILHRQWRCRDDRQRITSVHEQRIVHMGQPHLAALSLTLIPENWSGRIEFRAELDGRVCNSGVGRYQGLSHIHLRALEERQLAPDSILLKTMTNQSALQIAMAARTRAFAGERELPAERRTLAQEGYVSQLLCLEASQGAQIRVEKIVAVYTSKDAAISEPGWEAARTVARAPSFAALSTSHRRAWRHLWRLFCVELWHDRKSSEKDPIDMIVHLYIFHLLQTISINTMQMGLDVGVPSRGWHGEAYRGHVFWDELFIFPMLNWRLPQITRALLMYRYRRLGAARRIARRAGYAGAMYPWQSGSNGREESQRIHLNPRSGHWIPDHSHLQRHVNIAIAYNLHHYFQLSGDLEFMSFYGAEMMLEIARFLASLCRYNDALDRYEILHVMGPDEYHDAYPDAEQPGVNNNAYTNIMTVWVLDAARRVHDSLSDDVRFELNDKLQLHKEELAKWEEICRKMRVVFHADGIISQFDGYDDLKEFDWERYRQTYGDIQRLDRILEAEGDTVNRYKASKQADVLMLFYLLSAEELAEIFARLGYPFEYGTIPRNIEYYIKRTSHGSTLSRVVHAWVLARSDRVQSWELFYQALQSDVADIQGGTTAEGIHLGAMAGTVDQLQRGYTGIVTRDDVLWFNPCLPKELNRLRIRIRYRSYFLEVDLTTEQLRVRSLRTVRQPIWIGCKADVRTLTSDSALVFDLVDSKKQTGTMESGATDLSKQHEETIDQPGR